MYGVDGDLLARQYKQRFGGFEDWEYHDTAEEYVLFPENMGTHLSIDEICLSNDELYTIVTNKAFKGRKGSLVAINKPDFLAGYSLFYESARYGGDFMAAIENNRNLPLVRTSPGRRAGTQSPSLRDLLTSFAHPPPPAVMWT